MRTSWKSQNKMHRKEIFARCTLDFFLIFFKLFSETFKQLLPNAFALTLFIYQTFVWKEISLLVCI